MTDPVTRLAAALADRYRIERELGEGGMATVYVADDLKHDRQVAIKVLRPELAAVLGAERFVQEITTTAQLQHPNILPLFDSGSADGFLYYVMPYVEGETLRSKLDRETQLGIDESVKLVSEVADALQYAHEHGVVHRDIKPENILLHAGRPVVSDFGIALAVSAAAGGRMTETGLSLGTPHYMSPEQATAERNITLRSDVYSLGAVLYEMLTGDPPHTGKTGHQIIMKIVTEEPSSVTRMRKSVPPNVAAAVSKALEKLPADRFESTKTFADALANPGFRYVKVGVTPGGAAAPAAPVRRWKMAAFALGTVAVLAVAALVAAVLEPRSGGAAPHREIRFTVLADSGVYLGGVRNVYGVRPAAPSIALSPDGNLLAYAGWKADTAGNRTSQLYRRPLGQEQSEPIPGTARASIPFFSPDGKWIAFFEGHSRHFSLNRVKVAGGNVQTVVQDVPTFLGPPAGASWGDDGSIVYATLSGIYRVDASGGKPELLVQPHGASATSPSISNLAGIYGEPQLLPGGHTLLFHRKVGADPKTAVIVALDLASRKRTTLVDDAMHPLFVAPDHLLFMRRGTLMEVGFDPGRLRIMGEPRVVMEDVMQSLSMPESGWELGAGQVAVSRSGDLAWVAGGTYPKEFYEYDAFEVAADGHAKLLGWKPYPSEYPRVSPQGDRVVYDSGPFRDAALEVRDLARRVTQRLNTGGYTVHGAEWSPDGDSLVVASDADGEYLNIYKMAADGSGRPVRLAPSEHDQQPLSWSSQGVIAYLQSDTGDQFHIWTLAPGGKPTLFVADSLDMLATFSPDGRLLAYTSLVSGQYQVYVRPYPGPGATTQVSANGGSSPAWSRDGRHLYYLSSKSKGGWEMMVADVVSHDPFRVGRSRTMMDPWPYRTARPARNYDILRDGSFIALKVKTGRRVQEMYRADTVHVIVNFAGLVRSPPR